IRIATIEIATRDLYGVKKRATRRTVSESGRCRVLGSKSVVGKSRFARPPPPPRCMRVRLVQYRSIRGGTRTASLSKRAGCRRKEPELQGIDGQAHAVAGAPHPKEGRPVVVLGAAGGRIGEVDAGLIVAVGGHDVLAGEDGVAALVLEPDAGIAPHCQPDDDRPTPGKLLHE